MIFFNENVCIVFVLFSVTYRRMAVLPSHLMKSWKYVHNTKSDMVNFQLEMFGKNQTIEAKQYSNHSAHF